MDKGPRRGDGLPAHIRGFLAEELRELGATKFSEEYGLQFLDSGEQAFRTDIIDAIVSFEVKPLW